MTAQILQFRAPARERLNPAVVWFATCLYCLAWWSDRMLRSYIAMFPRPICPLCGARAIKLTTTPPEAA